MSSSNATTTTPAPKFREGDGVTLVLLGTQVPATVKTITECGRYISVDLEAHRWVGQRLVNRHKGAKQRINCTVWTLSLRPQPWQIELFEKGNHENVFLEWDGDFPGFRQYASLKSILALSSDPSPAKLAEFVSATGAVVVKGPSFLAKKSKC